MAWRISLVKNTVKVSEDCAQELRMVASDGHETELRNIWNARTGFLYFNPDWMEWMDWLSGNKAAFAILRRYRASGVVRFIDADQDKRSWQYVFRDGELEYSLKSLDQ